MYGLTLGRAPHWDRARDHAHAAAGVYVVMDLPPGHYDVTAHAPGFALGTVTGVSLTHWQVQQMDLALGDLPPSA